MGKRTFSISLALALVAGVFSASPAGAQEPAPVAIPATVQIDDPFSDGNYLNDQGNGGTSVQGQEVVPRDGDHTTSPDASTVGDLGKIWFENDAKDISVFVQTEVPVTANAPALVYDVFMSPGEGSVASSSFWCLRFSTVVEGHYQGQSPTWEGGPVTKIIDRCNVGSSFWNDSVDGTQEILSGPDGTGIVKMTFPRSFSPWLADGQILTTPYARAANAFGSASQKALLSAPQVDNTKFGLDYTITSGGPVVEPAPDPEEEPPGKSDPPGKGKKKGCKKGKGKKKGACPGKKPGGPKPPADSCPAYVPGEEGAEAETTIVTDAATEEKPVVVELDTAMGLGNDAGLGEFATGSPIYDETTRIFQNVQVDTNTADAGLYARVDFAADRDYDLYLNYPNGDEADHSGDFNPIANTVFSCGGTSCESSSSSEAILGLRTADCGGWTAEIVSFLTEGGGVTLSLWLGEALADPAPPAEDGEALGLFYSLMGV